MVLPKSLAEARAQRAITSESTSPELLAITPRLFQVYLTGFYIKFVYGKPELDATSYTACFDFPNGVAWCTGGLSQSSSFSTKTLSDVKKLEMYKDFTHILKAPMLCARHNHTALYHRSYIYAIGGQNQLSMVLSCERYDICGDRWEFIDTLPYNCLSKTAVILESTQSIYLFGGNFGSILCMELETLNWIIHSVKMPRTWSAPNVFKIDETQVFIVGNGTLYVFDPSLTNILNAGPTELANVDGIAYLFKGKLYNFQPQIY